MKTEELPVLKLLKQYPGMTYKPGTIFKFDENYQGYAAVQGDSLHFHPLWKDKYYFLLWVDEFFEKVE